MCRDQNLISETSGRTDGRTKIEKRGVGRPLLGPAKTTITVIFLNKKLLFHSYIYNTDSKDSSIYMNIYKGQNTGVWGPWKLL